MTDTTQAAVDATDATAKPVADVNDAQNTGDDLDTLLKQFDTETRVAPVSPPVTPQVQQPPVIDADRFRRVEDRLFQEDLNKAVANIKGDLNVHERAAKGWLDQIARERPEIARAFMEQASNPKKWQQIETVLAKEFARDFKSTAFDEQATEDRNAVVAAVRGASTPAPAETAPDYSKLSNSEIREEYRKLGINPTF